MKDQTPILPWWLRRLRAVVRENDQLRASAEKWGSLSWLAQKLTDPEVLKGYVGEAEVQAALAEREAILGLIQRRVDEHLAREGEFVERGASDIANVAGALASEGLHIKQLIRARATVSGHDPDTVSDGRHGKPGQ
jgi:hypothetical protein